MRGLLGWVVQVKVRAGEEEVSEEWSAGMGRVKRWFAVVDGMMAWILEMASLDFVCCRDYILW